MKSSGHNKQEKPNTEILLFRSKEQRILVVFLLCALLALSGRMYVFSPIDANRQMVEPNIFSVDLNTASHAELALLPGIGTVLAQRIIESRMTEGPFRDPDDLIRVKGIGPKKLAAVTPFLRQNK